LHQAPSRTRHDFMQASGGIDFLVSGYTAIRVAAIRLGRAPVPLRDVPAIPTSMGPPATRRTLCGPDGWRHYRSNCFPLRSRAGADQTGAFAGRKRGTCIKPFAFLPSPQPFSP
jgi:hypothetical protein